MHLAPAEPHIGPYASTNVTAIYPSVNRVNLYYGQECKWSQTAWSLCPFSRLNYESVISKYLRNNLSFASFDF